MSAPKGDDRWIGTWPAFLDEATEAPACRGADTSMFFPPLGGDARPAKAVCAGCPLVTECREWALSQPTAYVYGVWGGLCETERKALKRRKRTAGVAS